jgi:uncharacterized RDD family membrane protein YckC
MICRRCSHALPPFSERCPRCLALNAPRDAGAAVSIASDPPPPMTLELTESDPPDSAGDEPHASVAGTVPTASAHLFAWAVDLCVLIACLGLQLAVARTVLGSSRAAASTDYWLDLLLRGPRLPLLWAAVLALLAVSYSWVFAVLGGRTPGLALAGLRLESVRGGALSVREALLRAALSVPSAALGLAGFALALLDPRRQTLHDKLCGTLVVRS